MICEPRDFKVPASISGAKLDVVLSVRCGEVSIKVRINTRTLD